MKKKNEERKRFVPVTLHLQNGDIITSKKGILAKTILLGEYEIGKKIKIVSENVFFKEGDSWESITIKENSE